MSVNCPSSYIVLSCLRILHAWKGSMASWAVSEDGIPFGVGEDLLKSRRKTYSHKKFGARYGVHAPPPNPPPTKIHLCTYTRPNGTAGWDLGGRVSAALQVQTPACSSGSPANPYPVLAEGLCRQNRRGVCGDSAGSQNVPAESEGRSRTREAPRMAARQCPLNRLRNWSKWWRVPGLPIAARPDRPPPSTPSILPPLIPLHLPILLSGSSSSPPQLAAWAWTSAHLSRNTPPQPPLDPPADAAISPRGPGSGYLKRKCHFASLAPGFRLF